MKKIVVALDYSPASKNAFEYALLLAKDLKAELTLLNVVLPITNTTDYPIEIIDFARKNEKQRATRLLKKLTTYYPGKDDNQFILHNVTLNYLVKEGFFAPTIIHTAKELNADLIIAGAKSGHDFSKIILGSTVKELVRKTSIPTLVIPEGYTYTPIENIAYATTLAGKDTAAFLWLLQFSREITAKFQPFFISELPYDYSNIPEEVWESSSLPKENQQMTTVKMIRKATFQGGINYYLEHYQTDILAMFIPKRTFLQQLFHISKTQQMVVNSNIPLLIYHA